jgi:putative flippase GtrA
VGVAELPALAAQAASVVAATPLGFVGNKAWSFHREAPVAARPALRPLTQPGCCRPLPTQPARI